MIKVENVEVVNFKNAIRGCRNPLNSWDRSDSRYYDMESYSGHGVYDGTSDIYVIGPNDLGLLQRLYKAGASHRKYARQIFVSMDIVAPLYWWKEWDTYKVGTVANSCSTMHKIHEKEFMLDDFSNEHLSDNSYEDATELTDRNGDETDIFVTPLSLLKITIGCLNNYRKRYIQTHDKFYWRQIIQLLPSSYNQRRTVTFTYENAFAMIEQRSGHKLDEWRELVEILKGLPYMAEITGGADEEKD